MIWEME